MDFWSRIPKPFQRRMARWFARRPWELQLQQAVVSFTFDDFPRSALLEGGTILREHGFRGTYYASFGLMGKIAPTGQIFSRDDLAEFARQGHELACHTFDHHDSWNTPTAAFEASLLRNQQFVARELPGVVLNNFSYPISWPRPQTKRRTAKYYRSARGGGQTFNRGPSDLNYLKAFFIEQSRGDMDIIKHTIDETVRAKGWLIFATHDVAEVPTRFGCTPGQFRQIVDYTARAGATLLPVSDTVCRIAEAGVGQ